MFRSILAAGAVSAAALLSQAATAQAAVVRISEANFRASAGLITFSELPVGTVNPNYAPAAYGGGIGSPNVTTGGFFLGQSLSANAAVDCPGAAASACVTGSPTGSLTLDPSSPNAFIATDSSTPTSPGLSGSPTFNGPIALLFDTDQLGVGFSGGFFDAVGSTGITAFDRMGQLLGTVANGAIGIDFLGLVSATGTPEIAGVFLDLVGAEPSGFIIDNVRFGAAGDIMLPPEVPGGEGNPSAVPLPAGLPLLIGGLGALGLLRRRRQL